ncbi:suppressor of fused domain protein [Chitinophaga oryzae]|uniref:Suppressor of fused domain protein n=1 Tax=Chitinophaga oryzae TaxID=2725414 RepID=A0AAE6ZH55_9BACT|nr:suppressor of fused domain protein [Chitinophaga oryzae]QJB31704.1 suppressor of fused domain protein [Chitinophaga oryzae]QJB38188.1 suppressor of fused domain protein [Chitinophaga oryzae]
MDIEQYKQQFDEQDAVGWDCIDGAMEKLYPGQEPRHYAPGLYYALGGDNPLDGISVYESRQQADHLHFVTYGFSELYYDEEAAGGEFSKFGFELTFRLKKVTETEDPAWACNLLQNIAKYVFSSGKWFEEFHFIPANGPIRLEYETDITALAFIKDPELGTITTPHGEVTFLQMVGITTKEYESLMQNPTIGECEKLLQRLRADNPLLITDLDRK